MRNRDLGVRGRREHRLTQPADDERMVIGNEDAKSAPLAHRFLQGAWAGIADLTIAATPHRFRSIIEGRRSSCRKASVSAIVAATPTLSERSRGRIGMTSLMSADAPTASGTPAELSSHENDIPFTKGKIPKTGFALRGQ